MAYLEAKDITKQFGGLVAVDHVSFEVEKGEIVSIIGPNGAGKTTVFNMLTGIYPIDAGAITFDGQDIHRLAPQQIVDRGISRTFQNIRLFPNMRVIENVLVGTHIRTHYHVLDALFRTGRYQREEARTVLRTVEILQSIGLGDRIHDYAQNLPYGEQRKVEIARAIATDAKLLLLDEPAAGMNPNETEELMQTVRSVRDQFGIAILLIEHDMNFVMGICEEITVLDYGRIIARGDGMAIRNNPKVIAAYLGGD